MGWLLPTLLILSLVLGVALGWRFIRSETVPVWLGRLQRICLYSILLLIGFKIGLDSRVFEAAASLGLQSLILSISATAGSAFLTFLVFHFVEKRRGKKQ